jgi:hypothetical protein
MTDHLAKQRRSAGTYSLSIWIQSQRRLCRPQLEIPRGDNEKAEVHIAVVVTIGDQQKLLHRLLKEWWFNAMRVWPEHLQWFQCIVILSKLLHPVTYNVNLFHHELWNTRLTQTICEDLQLSAIPSSRKLHFACLQYPQTVTSQVSNNRLLQSYV